MLSHFGKVFTWDDDLVDNKKFFKVYYPDMRPRIETIVPFEEKKFCCMFATRNSSKHPRQIYSEREKMIRFFEDKPGEFDLFGNYWEKRKYKNWKGRIEDKLSALKHYKFNICYENMRDVRGYVTEKIFDCFATGVVPIYWGASNITDYISKETFIDRREFQNEQQLYDFLKSVTQEEYAKYLEAAEIYLRSEGAQRFTLKHFVETLSFHIQ